MQIRSPKKGEGVPRESIEKNCIGDLTGALIASPIEKVNAIAVSVLSNLYEKDIDFKLKWLKRTAALKGTWPRENSCGVLHNQFIRDGVESVLQKVYPWLMDSNEGVK